MKVGWIPGKGQLQTPGAVYLSLAFLGTQAGGHQKRKH